jgi:hypothetical protein
MKRARPWHAAIVAVSTALVCVPATAEPAHRVAAVDPDAQLVSALESVLSPWDVEIVQVGVVAPGPTPPFALERARVVAREAAAEVVIWVSGTDGQYALWIYELASDLARSRALEEPPPFTPNAAAGVALAVKVLLSSTAIAPPSERTTLAGADDTAWLFGADVGAAFYTGAVGASSPVEGRAGVHVWVSPAGLRPWGFALRVSAGTGLTASEPGVDFEGTVNDIALGLDLGLRVRAVGPLSIEPAVGLGSHFFMLRGVLPVEREPVSRLRVEPAVTSSVSAVLSFLQDRFRVGFRLGATLLPLSPRFLVGASTVLDVGPVSIDAALQAGVTFP